METLIHQASSNQLSELKFPVLDSRSIMGKVYPKVNQTAVMFGGYGDINLAQRRKVCSLRNSIEVNIDGKLFCLAHIGQRKHKDALQTCQNLNAALPLPKSFKEYHDFIESFKRLRIDEKMDDFSTKIVLDVRRLTKGKVSLLISLIR